MVLDGGVISSMLAGRALNWDWGNGFDQLKFHIGIIPIGDYLSHLSLSIRNKSNNPPRR